MQQGELRLASGTGSPAALSTGILTYGRGSEVTFARGSATVVGSITVAGLANQGPGSTLTIIPNSNTSSVNNLGTFGRWAFEEFTDVYEIEAALRRLIRDMATEKVEA